MSILIELNENALTAEFKIVVNAAVVSTFELNAATSMINLSELQNTVTLPFYEHQKNINQINGWIKSVVSIFNLNLTGNIPTLDRNYKISATECSVNASIDGYEFKVIYLKDTNEIRVKPRLATEFSFRKFRYFMDIHTNFIKNDIKYNLFL